MQLGDSDAKAEANQDSAATGLEAHITSSHSSLGAKDHMWSSDLLSASD
jgi:hypothetical protein